MLPEFLAKRSPHGTPLIGILFSASGVILLSWLSFQEIVANSPSLLPSPTYNYIFVSYPEKVYFTYELKDSSVIARVVMQLNGFLELSTCNNQTQNGDNFGNAPADNCDIYGQCPPYTNHTQTIQYSYTKSYTLQRKCKI
ncbi:G-type lectin S-receptor-like serine/threonine-protein kinase At4g27290 [Lycium ferocissimum]|uniref:G-type lectin S-receptor-like serine/threonine-protein kinase At4g27290 n=1 Tax=Lycium ferocissimum TaxID=112874 RepID=UPI002815082E|nr:G-type lectin S-receptor-like serine/threonine-protein kinase At4g27290 [Lycium ferocissimum]